MNIFTVKLLMGCTSFSLEYRDTRSIFSKFRKMPRVRWDEFVPPWDPWQGLEFLLHKERSATPIFLSLSYELTCMALCTVTVGHGLQVWVLLAEVKLRLQVEEALNPDLHAITWEGGRNLETFFLTVVKKTVVVGL